MFWRFHVRAGDTTTSAGRVEPRAQQYPTLYDGVLGAYESDPVWCPACKSHGAIQCVPPYRPDTGPDGRQRSLSGDLCLCKCSPPPRLVARFENSRVGLTLEEIAGMSGSTEWMLYAGHAEHLAKNEGPRGLRFRAVHPSSGRPLANRRYVAEASGQKFEGVTDAEGYTRPIESSSPVEVTVHFVFMAPDGRAIERRDLQP